MTDIINVAINLIAALMVLCTLVLFLKNNPRDYKAASAYFFLVLAALVMGIVGVAIEFVEGPANSGPHALANLLTEDIHMIAESQKIPVEAETFTKDRNESSIDFLTGLKQK